MHLGILNSNMSNDWVDARTADQETRRRLDEFLSVLAHRRRRELLYHLERVEVTDVETLASMISRAESEPDGATSDVEDRIRTNLVHVHLPKLEDTNAIEFDQRSEAVRCDGLPTPLERLLETCQHVELEEPIDE